MRALCAMLQPLGPPVRGGALKPILAAPRGQAYPLIDAMDVDADRSRASAASRRGP